MNPAPHPEPLTAVCLFDGVGGFPYALAHAGVRTVLSCEIDAAARGVIADRFPDHTLHADVRTLTADDCLAAGFVPARGIITAGFPCQDLSVAGNRKGLGGSRSGLYWEIVRLAHALRPRWLILENVPGLLSAVCPCPGDGRHDGCAEPHNVTGGACGRDGCMAEHGGAMGAILGSLGELGYGFAYRVLDAQHFGVPQRRQRVVIVGCLGDRAAPVEVLFEPESVRGDSAAGNETWPDLTDSARDGTEGSLVADSGIVTSLTIGLSSGGADLAHAQAGWLIPQAVELRNATMTGEVTQPLQVGGGSPSVNTVPHVIFSKAQKAHDPDDSERWEDTELAATLDAGGQVARTATAIVQPMALRGRDGGNMPELGEEGDPAFAVRPPDGGSSHAMVVTSPAVTAKWAKGTGGPAGDETQNLVVADPQLGQPVAGTLGTKSGGGRTTDLDSHGAYVAHALTAEGADASEDGTGRGTPLVPWAMTVAMDFSASEDLAQPIRASGAGRGQPGTIAWGPGSKRGEAYPIELRNATRTGGATGAGTPGTGIADDGDPSGTVAVAPPPAVATATAVRRLTPTECERLQGFPDGWTATSGGKAQADSPRYRQMGNAIATPVFIWVARRLAAVDSALPTPTTEEPTDATT